MIVKVVNNTNNRPIYDTIFILLVLIIILYKIMNNLQQ